MQIPSNAPADASLPVLYTQAAWKFPKQDFLPSAVSTSHTGFGIPYPPNRLRYLSPFFLLIQTAFFFTIRHRQFSRLFITVIYYCRLLLSFITIVYFRGYSQTGKMLQRFPTEFSARRNVVFRVK
jgi:hypothetical protein